MAGMIQQLTEVLENELDNYNKLLEIALKKTPIIIKGNIDELKLLVAQENEIVGNNQHIEKNRISIMNDISMVLNKEKDNLTLNNLIGLLNSQEEEQAKLKYISTMLSKTLNDLKIANKQNGELINQSLEYLDFNMNMIRSSQSLPPLSYQNDGIEKQSEGRNFFDRKQ